MMLEDDPDVEFVLPQWDGEELEWEVASSEEEDDNDNDNDNDVRIMYAL
jgi:hypothetical protein